LSIISDQAFLHREGDTLKLGANSVHGTWY